MDPSCRENSSGTGIGARPVSPCPTSPPCLVHASALVAWNAPGFNIHPQTCFASASSTHMPHDGPRPHILVSAARLLAQRHYPLFRFRLIPASTPQFFPYSVRYSCISFASRRSYGALTKRPSHHPGHQTRLQTSSAASSQSLSRCLGPRPCKPCLCRRVHRIFSNPICQAVGLVSFFYSFR